jgi:hypothetical protein
MNWIAVRGREVAGYVNGGLYMLTEDSMSFLNLYLLCESD